MTYQLITVKGHQRMVVSQCEVSNERTARLYMGDLWRTLQFNGLPATIQRASNKVSASVLDSNRCAIFNKVSQRNYSPNNQ